MKKSNEVIQKIFDLNSITPNENMWVWWFWLFTFENPFNSEKPRQLAIMWSLKKDDNLSCNSLDVSMKRLIKKDGSIEAVVAAWYFDGEKMHENFLLNRTELNQTSYGIKTPNPNTTFEFEDDTFRVVIDSNMEFEAKLEKGNKFTEPWFKSIKKFGRQVDMVGINKLDLKAKVNGKNLNGTAYFSKVSLKNVPAPSWYWGLFHFKNNRFLSYFNPYILKKSVIEGVTYYDGEMEHRFNNIKIKKEEGELPIFHITASDKDKKIEFSVETYSKAVWKFRKKKFKIIPINYNYNEYPSKVTNFKFTDLKNNRTITGKDIGIGIGNVEQTTGILI